MTLYSKKNLKYFIFLFLICWQHLPTIIKAKFAIEETRTQEIINNEKLTKINNRIGQVLNYPNNSIQEDPHLKYILAQLLQSYSLIEHINPQASPIGSFLANIDFLLTLNDAEDPNPSEYSRNKTEKSPAKILQLIHAQTTDPRNMTDIENLYELIDLIEKRELSTTEHGQKQNLSYTDANNGNRVKLNTLAYREIAELINGTSLKTKLNNLLLGTLIPTTHQSPIKAIANVSQIQPSQQTNELNSLYEKLVSEITKIQKQKKLRNKTEPLEKDKKYAALIKTLSQYLDTLTKIINKNPDTFRKDLFTGSPFKQTPTTNAGHLAFFASTVGPKGIPSSDAKEIRAERNSNLLGFFYHKLINSNIFQLFSPNLRNTIIDKKYDIEKKEDIVFIPGTNNPFSRLQAAFEIIEKDKVHNSGQLLIALQTLMEPQAIAHLLPLAQANLHYYDKALERAFDFNSKGNDENKEKMLIAAIELANFLQKSSSLNPGNPDELGKRKDLTTITIYNKYRKHVFNAENWYNLIATNPGIDDRNSPGIFDIFRMIKNETNTPQDVYAQGILALSDFPAIPNIEIIAQIIVAAKVRLEWTSGAISTKQNNWENPLNFMLFFGLLRHLNRLYPEMHNIEQEPIAKLIFDSLGKFVKKSIDFDIGSFEEKSINNKSIESLESFVLKLFQQYKHSPTEFSIPTEGWPSLNQTVLSSGSI